MKYKLIVAYDGTDYAGWQYQEDHQTIAGTLQKTFKEVFDREITIIGASRTDAGVHALGQVAMFETDLSIDAATMKFAWNNLLPESILVRDLMVVPDDFNPRHKVKEKIYYYHFYQERPLPFFARYGYFQRQPVDLEKLQKCLQVFVGTHDFRSFCTGYDKPDTVRTINEATIEYVPKYKCHRLIFKGPGFLRYMIRRISGACLLVASREMPVETLKQALAEKNPLQKLPTAPAQGLLLYKIIYNQE